jgi:SAM-dependent methyltransferase
LDGPWFDAFYASNGEDPWGFGDRWYERRKRALTLASLPRERFHRAFEPGCSLGILTDELAMRCEEVVATDVAAVAVRRARQRNAAHPGVRVEQGAVPHDWPSGTFDLIVLSEVGYYCNDPDLRLLCDRAAHALTTDGVLVACHWRHPVPEYPLTGDQVHDTLRAHPDLAVLAQHLEEDFVLEVFVPAPAVSVARAEGLLT